MAENGMKELILIAQDTTRYGLDIYGERKLVDLIRELSKIRGIEWIRLLYCYPEEISDELIDELAGNEKVCKYIDVPIQHISDRILKAMGRRGNGSDIKNALYKLRSNIPGVIIRTSLIVGFPGEEDSDFGLLYDFVREFRFDRLGVFTYSKEENTKAAHMKPQVNRKVKEKRQSLIMGLQKDIIDQNNRARLNKLYRTLVEGIAEDGIFYYGRTYAEAPDIDGLIYFTCQEPLEVGAFVNVKILNTDEYDLIGEVINESAE